MSAPEPAPPTAALAKPGTGRGRTGYVFVSYKREEFAHADMVRKALQDAGFQVWWDKDIQCGQVWNEELDKAVRGAGCIVVLWSKAAMQSRWVMHEASSAADRGIYAPVRIELCPIDPPYNRLQATDIVGWDGAAEHPGVADLLQRVEALLPPRRPLPVRASIWLWANIFTLATLGFAGGASLLLAMQKTASDKQADTLSGLIEDQKRTQSQQYLQYERQLQLTQRSNVQIARVLYPIHSDKVKICASFDYPFSHDDLSSAREHFMRSPPPYKHGDGFLSSGGFVLVNKDTQQAAPNRLAAALSGMQTITISCFSQPQANDVFMYTLDRSYIREKANCHWEFGCGVDSDQKVPKNMVFYGYETKIMRWNCGWTSANVHMKSDSLGIMTLPDLRGSQLAIGLFPAINITTVADDELQSEASHIDASERASYIQKNGWVKHNEINKYYERTLRTIFGSIDNFGISISLNEGHVLNYGIKQFKVIPTNRGVYFLYHFPQSQEEFNSIIPTTPADVPAR